MPSPPSNLLMETFSSKWTTASACCLMRRTARWVGIFLFCCFSVCFPGVLSAIL
jgi:hypothetical protein